MEEDNLEEMEEDNLEEMEEDNLEEMEEGDENGEDIEEDMEKQLTLMDDEVAHEDEPESESHPDCDEKGLRARLHRMNINRDRAPVPRIPVALSPSRPTSISISIQLAGTKMFRKVDDCMCTQWTFKEFMGKASKTLGFDVRGRLSARMPGHFTRTRTKLDVDSDEAWHSVLQMCWSQKRGRYIFFVVAENADI
jgi:hypothetical protein